MPTSNYSWSLLLRYIDTYPDGRTSIRPARWPHPAAL